MAELFDESKGCEFMSFGDDAALAGARADPVSASGRGEFPANRFSGEFRSSGSAFRSVPSDAESGADEVLALGATHSVAADVVGRIVAELALASQLLADECARRPEIMWFSDMNGPTNLIVEWGMTLAWAGNPAVALADEMLIDQTIATLTAAVGCINPGIDHTCRDDWVHLRDNILDTIAVLREPLWRCP